MKGLLTLTSLSNTDIVNILELATQMRRVVCANYKKSPQLLGSVVGGIFENDTDAMPYNLATAYMSGTFVSHTSVDGMDMGRMLDNMGANTIVVGHSNDNIASWLHTHCKCDIINAGSSSSDPIAVLSQLMALTTRLDSLVNLEVLVVGNKKTNIIAELIHCLELFGSSLIWYLPSGDYATARRGIVVDKLDVAFGGADAVIDIGLTPYADSKSYYGGTYIDKTLLDKCRVDVPLLGSRVITEGNNIVTYPHQLVDTYESCYISVVMAVLYCLKKS